MVNGQWSMVNGQWSMVNGQWSMVNGQWSMVNGQASSESTKIGHFLLFTFEFLLLHTHESSGISIVMILPGCHRLF